MERLCKKENALQAIEEINEDRKDNKTAQWVERTKEERAEELCKIARNFHPKPARTFERYDPTAGKTRIINEPALWPDQYIHHMIVQVLKPILMRGMDYFCCGSIPGRGPHREKKAIEKWLDKDRKGTKYGGEADIKKFPISSRGYEIPLQENQGPGISRPDMEDHQGRDQNRLLYFSMAR